MRYINPRFTYLLTYLLTYSPALTKTVHKWETFSATDTSPKCTIKHKKSHIKFDKFSGVTSPDPTTAQPHSLEKGRERKGE